MTFLAFDPDQLRALALRARMALVELAALPTNDPAAEAADRAVRAAMRTLQLGLLPAVQRVLASPPLRAPVDRYDDVDALPYAAIRELVTERGWSVGVDPLADDRTRVTREEAAALARRLRAMQPREVLDDPDTAAWLTAELRVIAGDVALSRLFGDEFGRWVEWADELAERHALVHRSDGDLATAARRLDDLLGALAAVAAGRLEHDATTPDRLAWLDDARPYGAALFLGRLDLPAGMLAGLAARTLRRAPDPLDGIGPTTADLVLQAVLRRPDAVTRFTVATIADGTLLTAAVADPALRDRLLRVASDPSTADVADAGRILVPVLRAVADGTAPPLRATVLADLVAPWTPQFLAADHEWGVPATERARLLRTALRSTAAVERLVERQDAVLDGARRTFVDGRARPVADFTAYLGAMGVILMDERVHRTVSRRQAWDTICNLAGMATAFIPWAAVGLAASAAVVVIHNQHVPDVRAAQRESLFMADAALTQAGATVVATMFATYVRRGWIAEDAPPPPDANPASGDVTSADYLWRFLDWEDTLPGGIDGDIADSIRAGLYEIVNPAQISEHVWWIANGFPGE